MPFNGLAVYSSGQFNTLAEDVSSIVGMISPHETIFLDALSQPERAAQSVLHEWLDEKLSPDTVSTSIQLLPAGTDFSPHVSGTAVAGYMRAGAVLENERTGEHVQIAAITGNTVTLTRGFASTTAATVNVGDTFFVIADAANEGDDVSRDTTRPRSRSLNYVQLIKKDVIVSGTRSAVRNLGSIEDEFAHQKNMRIKEALRDLEKAVLRSRLSGNTIGGSAVEEARTMNGLYHMITTNVTSTGTMTPDVLDTIIEGAWDQGGTDLNLIVAGKAWKRVIDNFNSSRSQVIQGGTGDELYKRLVTHYTGTYGDFEVQLNRNMPDSSLLVVSTERVHVVPLEGRSFQFEKTAKTGDAEKGMLVGEYTVEVHNEEGLAKAYG